MDRWNGRVALVTGASSGIGVAICKTLVKEGMIVVGCARRVTKIQELADEMEGNFPGKLHAIKCDLAEESEITKMFLDIWSTFGRLDVCINNAGLCIDSPLIDGWSSRWKAMLEVNILALCICTREAVKLMRETELEESQIIQISSLWAHRLPRQQFPGFNFYCSTKFMVRALAEGLTQEVLAGNTPTNIVRVACISPGITDTPFLSKCFASFASAYDLSTMSLKANEVADIVLNILRAPPTVTVNEVLLDSTCKRKGEASSK